MTYTLLVGINVYIQFLKDLDFGIVQFSSAFLLTTTLFFLISRKMVRSLLDKEIFEQNVYGETSFINLNNHGYEMKNNTDHEIKELAKEVCEFLNGKTVISENQKNFYKEIKNIFKFYKKENLLGPNPIMIGEDFIKKNMDYIN